MSYTTRARSSLKFHPAWTRLKNGQDQPVILLSRDDVAFRVHLPLLEVASGFFRSMGKLQLPWPVPEGHVVVLELPAATGVALGFALSAVVNPEVWNRQVKRPQFFSLDVCEDVITLAEKYELPRALRALYRFAISSYCPKILFRSPNVFVIFTLAVLANDLEDVRQLHFSLLLLARPPDMERDRWALETLQNKSSKAFEALRSFFINYYAALDKLAAKTDISQHLTFPSSCRNNACPNFRFYSGDYHACMVAAINKSVEMLKYRPEYIVDWIEKYDCGSDCEVCGRDINVRVGPMFTDLPERIFLFSMK